MWDIGLSGSLLVRFSQNRVGSTCEASAAGFRRREASSHHPAAQVMTIAMIVMVVMSRVISGPLQKVLSFALSLFRRR